MVANERMHGATGSRSLLLELHQEIHHWARIGTAVDHVAGLNQVRLAAGPVPVSIDEARGGEHAGELLVIAVDIADRDDALHTGPDVLFRFLRFCDGGLAWRSRRSFRRSLRRRGGSRSLGWG